MRKPLAGVGALLGRAARLAWFGSSNWSPYRIDDIPPYLREVREGAIEAYHAYRPEPFDGKVTLFRSETGDPLSCDQLKV
jgi:hypothetical protein